MMTGSSRRSLEPQRKLSVEVRLSVETWPRLGGLSELVGNVTRDLRKPSLARDQLWMEEWNLWWESSSPVRQPRLVFFLRMMFSWNIVINQNESFPTFGTNFCIDINTMILIMRNSRFEIFFLSPVETTREKTQLIMELFDGSVYCFFI